MRTLRFTCFLLFIAGIIAACGARTPLGNPYKPVPSETGGTGGSPSTTSSMVMSVTSTSIVSASASTGGTTMHPVISDSPQSGLQSETSVATASNGFVAVAWIDLAPNGSTVIGYTFSTDDGATFQPPQFEDTPLMGPVQASDPVLVVDGANNFYLTWVGYLISPGAMQPTDMHVFVAKAPAGTTTFFPPVEASKPQSTDEFHDKPWITVTGAGTIVVTYATATQLSSRLMAARSTDGGLSFQQSVISQDQNVFRNLAYPCAARNGKRLWVTYLVVSGTMQSDVGLTWSDDEGATWLPIVKSPLINTANEAVAFTDPTCVGLGNEVWIAYGLSKDPLDVIATPALFAIRLAHSADAGETVANRIDVHDPQAAPLYMLPQLAQHEDGSLELTYYAGQSDKDPDGTFRKAHAANPNTGFSPSVPVEAPIIFSQSREDQEWLGDYTGLVTRAGAAYMSYVVNTDITAHVAFARINSP